MILEKKRETERRRYERIKNDPEKWQEFKKKEHLQYLKKKEKGIRKLVKDMNSLEHRKIKEQWREYGAKSRNKKKK